MKCSQFTFCIKAWGAQGKMIQKANHAGTATTDFIDSVQQTLPTHGGYVLEKSHDGQNCDARS